MIFLSGYEEHATDVYVAYISCMQFLVNLKFVFFPLCWFWISSFVKMLYSSMEPQKLFFPQSPTATATTHAISGLTDKQKCGHIPAKQTDSYRCFGYFLPTRQKNTRETAACELFAHAWLKAMMFGSVGKVHDVFFLKKAFSESAILLCFYNRVAATVTALLPD